MCANFWYSPAELYPLLLSRTVTHDCLWPHGLQHARLPCPSPFPRACSNSCPLNQWCHPTTSSSVVPFSSGLQSFPASGSFLIGQFFESGGQSIGVSASTSVLPVNTQDWSLLGWTGWISLQSKPHLHSANPMSDLAHELRIYYLILTTTLGGRHSSYSFFWVNEETEWGPQMWSHFPG